MTESAEPAGRLLEHYYEGVVLGGRSAHLSTEDLQWLTEHNQVPSSLQDGDSEVSNP